MREREGEREQSVIVYELWRVTKNVEKGSSTLTRSIRCILSFRADIASEQNTILT